MEAIKFADEFVRLFDRKDREEYVESIADEITAGGEETGDKAVLVINALLYALALRGNEAAVGVILAIGDAAKE
jgi:hypothetical protein